MKYSNIILGGLVAFAGTAVAMPTQEETKKVEPLVLDLMKDDQVALKSGKKTRVEVAESAMALADKADSEAAKLLLMKGAFNLYVRAGEFDKAIETLQSLQAAIPDIPPANMANIIEASLRVVSRKNGGQLYRLLDETKTRMRYTSAAKKMEKSLKENPNDRQLRTKLAEHYAYLGKWDKALENFIAADGKAGVIAKAEQSGEAGEKAADFWWSYPTGKADELVKSFRVHAAKLYEDAIADGKITGLNKVQAERRIEESKEYGENIFETETCDGLYCVIDISGGANAKKYPVAYLNSMPTAGLNDDYRTSKLLLRKIKPGTLVVGNGKKYKISQPFYMGVFEVTRHQYGLVCGRGGTGDMLPETVVSYLDLRGSQRGKEWPNSNDVDADSFMGRIRAKTQLVIDLPTEVQWEYACRAGTKSIYNNGGNSDKDMFEVGLCKENCKDGKPAKVGSFKPNKWGLYDMHGNAWEWCLDLGLEGWAMFDWSQEPKETSVDPKGHEKGIWHFVRGGCFNWKSSWCGSSWRHKVKEGDKHGDGGFRISIQPMLFGKGGCKSAATSAVSMSSNSFKLNVKAGTRTKLQIDKNCEMLFSYCPAGSMNILFKKSIDPSPYKKQIISRGYWLGCVPVSPIQWTALLGPQSDLQESKDVALRISYENMKKYLEILNSKFGSKLPSGYEFRFPTSAEFSQAQAALNESKSNPFWPVDENPNDWQNNKKIPNDPNPWGLEKLGSFAHVLYDTTSCSDEIFAKESAKAQGGIIRACGGLPWYGFEQGLPTKDPVLITPNGRPLTTGFLTEVWRKGCYVCPSGRVALRVCVGPKIK